MPGKKNKWFILVGGFCNEPVNVYVNLQEKQKTRQLRGGVAFTTNLTKLFNLSPVNNC